MKKLTKTSIGLGAVAAVTAASALVVFAWGPTDRKTFTGDNPADYVTFNSIIDNPALAPSKDERYFVAAKKVGDNTFTDTSVAEDGKEYVVRMYVHNNAAANLNLVAENVRAYAMFKTDYATEVQISGKISSTNAKPQSVWDETKISSKDGKKFKLNVVSGSAEYKNNAGTFKLDDSKLVNSDGVLLGYEKMDGKIPGCNQYSGWLTFRVKVEYEKVKTPGIEITKEVQIVGTDTWSESVKVKAGDEVRYRIHAVNTGETSIDNFTVRDTLSAGQTYVSGTAEAYNTANPKGFKLSDNLFSNGGANLGKYNPGAGVWIYLNAKIDQTLFDKCGNSTLENLAELSGGSATGTKSDKARVEVEGKVCTEGFTLDKKVRLGNNAFTENITAKAGDKVEYRIQFKNTGNVELKNVVIRDVLPSNMTYVKGSTNLDGKKLADGVISDKGINIGTVAAGKTVNLYFFVTMNGDLANICEAKTLTNTAKAKYNNDGKTEKSDTAVVTVNGKDCTEKDNPGFTINKMVQLDGGKEWAENVTAKAGDKVRYRIQFKNTGNVTLKNVVIRDVLPTGMTYVKGTTVLYNAANTNGKTLTDGIVSKEGINIGDYAKDTEATIYFYATVNASLADNCDDSTLTNVAKGRYNNDDKTEKSDTADVSVNGKDCKEPEEPEPELPKTGATTVISGVVGAASVATAAGYYIISRKKLN